MNNADNPAPDAAPSHDHQLCVQQALSAAEHLCAQRGVQLTAIRLQVLELIWQSHKAVKAYELLDRIKPLKNEAKPATIYRALDFLITQGLVHRVESLNAFIGCRCSSYSHERLLLICKHCQEVEERTPDKVFQALSNELTEAGFTAHSKTIEIHGVCRKCSEHAAHPLQTN